MTIKEILEKYPNLPKKFLVKFVLFCANDVRDLMKDKRSIKALESVQLWLEDKLSNQDMRKAANSAYIAEYASYVTAYAPDYAAYSAYYATYAVDCATYSTYAVDCATYAAAAYWTSKALGISEDKYKVKLLEMIDELDDMEKLIYLK